mgnify:CR=1 FL=1
MAWFGRKKKKARKKPPVLEPVGAPVAQVAPIAQPSVVQPLGVMPAVQAEPAVQQPVIAVAPIGVERVSLAVPENLDELVIVGQNLEVIRVDGRDVVSALGRPVAVLSNAMIEYRPR